MTTLITYGVAFIVIWLTLIACASTARWFEQRKIRKARHQAYLDLMYAEEQDRRRKRDHDEFRRNNPRPSRPLRPRDYE
jgi:hypothetical protein